MEVRLTMNNQPFSKEEMIERKAFQLRRKASKSWGYCMTCTQEIWNSDIPKDGVMRYCADSCHKAFVGWQLSLVWRDQLIYEPKVNHEKQG